MGVEWVLVVDDQEPFLRAMMSVVEETSGFEVVGAASSGEESLVVAASAIPDQELMDMIPPDQSGRDTTPSHSSFQATSNSRMGSILCG